MSAKNKILILLTQFYLQPHELTPEIGDMVIGQEKKAWVELSEALDNFAKTIGVNPNHSSEWEEWKEVARYNSLHTITTYVL